MPSGKRYKQPLIFEVASIKGQNNKKGKVTGMPIKRGDYLEFHYFPTAPQEKITPAWDASAKIQSDSSYVSWKGQKPRTVILQNNLFNEWGDQKYNQKKSRGEVNTFSPSGKPNRGYFNVDDSLDFLRILSSPLGANIPPPTLLVHGLFSSPFKCVIKSLTIRPVAYWDVEFQVFGRFGDFDSSTDFGKKVIRAFVDIELFEKVNSPSQSVSGRGLRNWRNPWIVPGNIPTK